MMLALQDGLGSMWQTASPQAASIRTLTTVFLVVLSIVFIIVLVLLAMAARRGRTREAADQSQDARLKRWVIIGGVLTTLIILVLTMYSYVADESLRPPGKAPITIKITGVQWWWKLEYTDTVPSNTVVTANELHVPVGTPVRVYLESNDVIHSSWIPGLNGKKDLIPGEGAETWFTVEKPGVYRGQCAEFCGMQHAHMALLVIAEPKAQYERWLALQRTAAAAPTTPDAVRGQKVFESYRCALCHSIRGTSAGGNTAPDLTHLASRRTIAAGSYPNRRGYLAGWILDPQSMKHGVRMPPNNLEPGELHALLAYLETLE